MGCSESNTNDPRQTKQKESKSSSPRAKSPKRVESKTLVMEPTIQKFNPFLFHHKNNKFLERVKIIENIIEDTEGFHPEFLLLRESASMEGFDDNLDTLLEEFNEILSVANINKEEFSDIAKFMIAENHILQKRLVDYQVWNVPEIIITTYKDYIASNKKRYNRKRDESGVIDKILKSNSESCPWKQNGPLYEPRNVPRGLPFDFKDINRNFSFNIKFNEMQVICFILERSNFTNEELMTSLIEFIKTAQNLITVAIILFFEKDDVDGATDDPFDYVTTLLEAIAENEHVNSFMIANANKIDYTFSDLFLDAICRILSKEDMFAFHVSGVNLDMRFIKALEHSKLVLAGFNVIEMDNDEFVNNLVNILASNKKLQALYLAGLSLSEKQLDAIRRILFANKDFKVFEYLSESDI